jgi:hypothetical protein
VRENGGKGQPLGEALEFGMAPRTHHRRFDRRKETFRQQLIPDFLSRYALDQALTVLRPADAKEFKRRSASWPQMLKTLVFEPQSTH